MTQPTVDHARRPGPERANSGTRRRRECTRWGQRLRGWRRSLFGVGGLRILAAAAGGFAIYSAFAPSTMWWLAIAGFTLLGVSLDGRTWRAGMGLAFVFALTFYLPLLSFTNIYVGDFPWYALSVAEAVFTAPVGGLIAAASRRLPLWPAWAAAVWITGEALRGRYPFGGFPWGGIAFSQPDGPLLPAASLIGSAGLGFLTALAGFAAAALVRALVRRPRPPWRSAAVLGSVAMLVLPLVLGAIGLATMQRGAESPTTTIAVIQGNVPRPGLDFNAERRAVLDLHAKQTHQLAADVRAGKSPKPTLVIWPENSTDIDPYRNADANAVISAAAADIGVPILVGAVVQAPTPGEGYNMGIVWDPVTGPGETYTKRHPLPFGEYMPYRSFFRLFSDKVDLQRGAFLPGERPGNFDIAGVPVGDVICFEVVYDDLVRDVINGGAQVLVVQTNNATFGYTNETYQQQAMSRVRAVEHGRSVLISSTSGVSTVIRPDGTIESSIPLFTAGYLTPSVPLIGATTPGTVLGGPLEWLLALATPAALAYLMMQDRRRRRAASLRPAHDSPGGSAGPGSTTTGGATAEHPTEDRTP